MKIRQMLFAAALLASAGAFSVGCTQVGDRSDHVALDQTPPAVMDGFHREFPGLVLSHTDVVHTADGGTEYNLKFHDATRRYHTKLFSADGHLLEDKSTVALPVGQPVGAQPMPPPMQPMPAPMPGPMPMTAP